MESPRRLVRLIELTEAGEIQVFRLLPPNPPPLTWEQKTFLLLSWARVRAGFESEEWLDGVIDMVLDEAGR